MRLPVAYAEVFGIPRRKRKASHQNAYALCL
jgi:hypothetical protein